MNLYRLLPLIAVCLIPGRSIAEGSPNYGQLERQCQGAKDPGCCMKGVRKMKEGHFTEAQDGKCPDGSKKNSLSCSGGKEWCEAPDPADISVTGPGIAPFKKTFGKDSDDKRGK